MAGAARPGPTCLLLGATGVGKSLLGKRLRNIRASWGSRGAGPGWGRAARCFWPVLNAPAQLCSRDGAKELGEPPATLPTVGTNLTDLTLHKRVTLRELGGCMGPIWPSYYGECSAVLFVIDAANPTQVSASCVQLLSLLSAEQLAAVPVLILFNKIDLPCYMSLVEMKSLFRLQDIVSCATQPITILETSARDGTGLADVLQWLQATFRDPS
ncbi:ADP-ribosylation factor-like protein 16 [Centrocercus urophasianus]|uniref:ADP-ribosylation factor-like protein 16 n=1 Tax=Centrocercus urophasianus TaxID=9002 RepID=UPI001C64F6AD|nr:ADP-ribosylation factor-like protein 16 [Centrocercus urophasianus]XP_042689258.1 ADP-ribosylation factor-like protein 16 [Centrocercus urophasianus]XP_042689259.1 ADP-ribosylation factor-like protein 16 [Centrocercus urophasianus]XP_042689260.1 ADP-ribosylation factor-like protein 16 [Centrocercus urophasianus]XP_042689261.1 ADP-ribosylation factor-like protein 16 [Centrocercus urophasianus]